VFHWELDEPAEGEFAGLNQFARRALAELMDAVVLVDPADYQRGHWSASVAAVSISRRLRAAIRPGRPHCGYSSFR
jgi:hypothetical protein